MSDAVADAPLPTALRPAPPMWRGLHALALRDLRIAARRRAYTAAVPVFFVLVCSLFPLAVGPQPALLREIGAGAIWVTALLASLLSLPRLFADDFQDGTLDALLLSAHPLGLLVLAKAAAHWASSGLPLVLLAPLLALQFGLDVSAAAALALSLALGTPVLSLLGALGAALTLGVRGAGVLVSLLILPLCVPVLVFGAGTVQAQSSGLGPWAHVSLLGAQLLLALAVLPWATAAALRMVSE